LIAELADLKNRDGFRITVIEFDHTAVRVHFGEPSGTLNLVPAKTSGGTDFNAALTEALNAIREFKSLPNDAGWHYIFPITLLLSDGQSSIKDSLIQEIQEESKVITIAYGSDADADTLSRISSDGEVHVVGTDGGALRDFLAEVGKTLSQTLQSNRE